MQNPEILSSNGAFTFAAEHNLPLTADLNRNFDWFPRLSIANMPIHGPGVEYMLSQIDYLIGETNVQANRIVAQIPPGERTELAYWTAQAPATRLTVHQGLGELLLARMYKDGEYDFQDVLLEPTVPANAQRPLPPRSFYCLRASSQSPEPLVVSSFYQPAITSWEGLEIELDPSQRQISTLEGDIDAYHTRLPKSSENSSKPLQGRHFFA